MRVTAKVQITLEVSLLQPWDGKETCENVHRVAARDSVQELRRMLGGSSHAHLTIVGEPKVFTVTAED